MQCAQRFGVVKYHDSIKQADKKLILVTKQLQMWHLPATPINYAVAYEFINNQKCKLAKAITAQLASGKKLDNYFIEELFQIYIMGNSSFRDEMITDIDHLITQSDKSNQATNKSAEALIKSFDDNLDTFSSGSKDLVSKAVNKIQLAANRFKQQQKELKIELLACKKKSLALKDELDSVKKEIYMDPLTGLYNRKALNKHIEAWRKESPNKALAGIVICIDQLNEVNQQFGDLISDVLLTKIANKVSSYVGESGLPVRSGGDEFLILLPDLDCTNATEIGEKIRQGIEKLRFVSSKSGVRFPQMTVSMAVNDFSLDQSFNNVLGYSRTVVADMQRTNNNQLMKIS